VIVFFPDEFMPAKRCYSLGREGVVVSNQCWVNAAENEVSVRKEDGKRKEPTAAEEKIDIEKINFIQKLEDNTRDVLKEWKKVSSLLWRESKPKSADDQSVLDQSIKVDETPVEKTIEPEKKEGKTNRKIKEKAKSD